MRIVSLLPSATDIVVALGGEAYLVGVSHSCGLRWQHLPTLTRTWVDVSASSGAIDAQVRNATAPLYALDAALLEEIAPDVVISQSLCDVCAVPSGDVLSAVEGLSSRPVLVDLAPERLADLPGCFDRVGEAMGRPDDADALCRQWRDTLERYRGRFAHRRPRVAVLDWVDPAFVAGHWVPDMLSLLGCEPLLIQPGLPSHPISWADLVSARPEAVIAACCGFTQQRTEVEAALPAELAGVPFRAVDGYELFSRPSPALLPSLACLEQALIEMLDLS